MLEREASWPNVVPLDVLAVNVDGGRFGFDLNNIVFVRVQAAQRNVIIVRVIDDLGTVDNGIQVADILPAEMVPWDHLESLLR